MPEYQTERTDAVEHFENVEIREVMCGAVVGGTPLIAADHHRRLDCVEEVFRYQATIEAAGENVVENRNKWDNRSLNAP